MDRIRASAYQSSHDAIGQRVEIEWSRLAARLQQHVEGEKDGPALAFGWFAGRRLANNLLLRSAIALDIETDPATGVVPPEPSAVADALHAMRRAAIVYTTHSHKADAPRYRVILPLDRPVVFLREGTTRETADTCGQQVSGTLDQVNPESTTSRSLDPWLAAVAASEIGLIDVTDKSKLGASSLFFLPRHVPGTVDHKSYLIEGDPFDRDHLTAVATMCAEREVMVEAERARLRALTALPEAVRGKIEAFNAAHPIPQMLERYGYQRHGGRWKSRYQHEGSQPATTVIDGGQAWVSFSDSDAAAGVGSRPSRLSSQCACFGDSFGLFTHYEHDGSFRRAIESLGD